MANFHGERVAGETLEERGEVSHVFGGTVKRKRELQKNGAKAVGGAKNVKPGASFALVRGGGRGGERTAVVSEALPEFGGEKKTWIFRDAVEPLTSVVRAERLVKGSVDFDGVEELRKVGEFVEAFGAAERIDEAGPIGIRPSGGADIDIGTGKRSFGRGAFGRRRAMR